MGSASVAISTLSDMIHLIWFDYFFIPFFGVIDFRMCVVGFWLLALGVNALAHMLQDS